MDDLAEGTPTRSGSTIHLSRTLIFDLSEVLIAGLVGVEVELAAVIGVPPDAVLPAIDGRRLERLFCGIVTEDAFLAEIVSSQGWRIPLDHLKQIIRLNFGRTVPGMPEAVTYLAAHHELVLLSDHAREWVEYIRAQHPFLRCFRRAFFSFELGQTKRERSTFARVLEQIGRAPSECLFIDDSAANIATATAAGIQGWRFTSAPALWQALRERGLCPPDVPR